MWSTLDLDGNVRVVKGTSSVVVDVGAYEHRSFAFKVVQVEKILAGKAQLTWNSRPGDTYSVWSRPGLPAGMIIIPWTEEASVPSGGETTSWTDLVMSEQRKFYRVELRP